MNLNELALLMGKTRKHLEEELKNNEVIELKLVERERRLESDEGNIIVLE